MTTAIALATDGALRLAKVCGMFGSHHVGERAAAAAQANRIVRDLGLTWRDIFVPGDAPARPLRRKIRFCLQHDTAMNEWEYEFLLSIAHREDLSLKQTEILNRLYHKAQRRARAAA